MLRSGCEERLGLRCELTMLEFLWFRLIHPADNGVRFFKSARSVTISAVITITGGSNSVVECQLPKLDVAGSIPVSRSKILSTKSFSEDRKSTRLNSSH